MLGGRLRLPWRSPHIEPGMRLGKHRIVRRLAVGGMAEIFLARTAGIRGFEKLVVVKRLQPQFVSSQNVVRMFLDEARLMATLNHANITQVYEVGEARGGFFFAMEYVHGEDLRALLRAAGQGARKLPIEFAMGVIAEAAAGLHHAHEKRGNDGQPLLIVHRDVSPSNVLVSFDGAVKLTDFGVAKWARQDSETRHGTLKGKCAYMSPEQCKGEPLDRRSDVFALGILLYELTTGTRLFQGASDFAILNQIATGRIAPPSEQRPDYPPALERIVMRALARSREQRFASARDLQLALEALAHEERLVMTPAARARYMQALFAAKLAAWRAAEGAGRSLGQHLASLPEEEILGHDDGMGGSTGEAGAIGGAASNATLARDADGTRATGVQVPVMPAVGRGPTAFTATEVAGEVRGGRGRAWVMLTALALAGATVAWWRVGRESAAPVVSPAGVAKTPATAAVPPRVPKAVPAQAAVEHALAPGGEPLAAPVGAGAPAAGSAAALDGAPVEAVTEPRDRPPARKAPARRAARDPTRSTTPLIVTAAAPSERAAPGPSSGKAKIPVVSPPAAEPGAPAKASPNEKPTQKIWDPDSVLLPK